MRKSFVLILILTVCVVSFGCKRPWISEHNVDQYFYVVARVDTTYSITMPQLFEALNESRLLPYGGTLPVSEVRLFLDSILVDTIGGSLAREVDLSDHYEQYDLFRRQYHSLLVNEYSKYAVDERVEVDSLEVLEFFNNNPDLFFREEQIYIHHILVSAWALKDGPDSLYYRSLGNEKLHEEAARYAQQIKERLDSGMTFSEAAQKYSHDVMTADLGGELGWVVRNRYKHPFDSIAFALEPGEYSNVYRDEDGWHIVLVTDHRPPGVPPLDSTLFGMAKGAIAAAKTDSIVRPLIDSLRQEVNLEFNEAVLDTNVYKVDRWVWAAVVNGIDTIDFNELREFEEKYRRANRIDNSTVEMKKEMIRERALRYAVIQAARAAGIDTLPDVVKKRQSLLHHYRKTIFMADRKLKGYVPPDSAVERYFEEHQDEFVVHKPLTVQQIIVEDSVLGEFVRDQALAGVDFLELAEEYYPGEPSLRRELADLGAIGPEDVSEEFYKSALLTPPGSVSRPIKTEYGYHLIKVVSRTDNPDAARVRHKILPILKEEKAREVFAEFRDKLYSRVDVSFPNKLHPVHLKPVEYR